MLWESNNIMAYVGSLTANQQIYVDNQGEQTIVTVSYTVPGQQQQSSTSLSIGTWIVPPILFRVEAGFILRIEANMGITFVQIQAGSLGIVSQPPLLTNAEVIPLRATTTTVAPSTPPSPLPPMAPLPPLQMPGMEMQMQPMQMRMGNMELNMGTMATTPSPQGRDRFCSQCGTALRSGDRFCPQCGHRLYSPGSDQDH